jgi:hypothetical protein
MTKWQWLSGKLWMHKWILALILIVLITDYIITKPLFQFTDAQIKIITPLVTFNSILLAAAGIMYQVQATNEREIESKIHQQKRETYVLLLEFIAKFFENMREQGTTIDPATIVSRREYIDLNFKLSTFASKEVIKTFYKFQHPDQELYQKNPGEWAVIQFGTLFKQMRKEISFQEGDVTARELLSLWMTDAYESKYDALFKKLN